MVKVERRPFEASTWIFAGVVEESNTKEGKRKCFWPARRKSSLMDGCLFLLINYATPLVISFKARASNERLRANVLRMGRCPFRHGATVLSYIQAKSNGLFVQEKTSPVSRPVYPATVCYKHLIVRV